MTTKTKRINQSLRGRAVVFDAYDGNRYTAHVEKVRNGVAKILYQVRGKWVNAYVDDGSRLIGSGC